MHEISQQNVELAQHHAKDVLKHGKSIEELGKRLQNHDETDKKIGQQIEAHGKNIQKHGQESLEKAQKLAEDNSTNTFTQSVEAHINASQIHIEAVKEFQKTHLSQEKKDS
jgi:exonuclease VII large subunit